jgi:hypothetical protein
VSTTTTTGASPRVLMNDDAAMVMTNVRCEHESACDDIGASKRFTDHDACRRSLFPASSTAVRPETCPAGVDETKLTACLAALRDQLCAQPREAPIACRSSALCVQ